MPIIKMKKMLLFAHQDEKEMVVKFLRELGVVELADVKEDQAWAEISDYLVPDQASEKVAQIESKLGEIRYCLDFLQRHYPVRKNLLQQLAGAKVSLTPSQYEDYIGREEEVKKIYALCRNADDRMTQIKNETTRTDNLIAELGPWLDFTLPLDKITNSGRVRMQLGTVPTDALPDLAAKLDKETEAHYLDIIKKEKDLTYCFFIYLANEAAKVEELYKEAGVSQVSFQGLSETAADSVRVLQQKKELLEKERETAKEQVRELLAHRPLLMAHYDHLNGERAKKEVVGNFARTETSFLLEGWVPEPVVEIVQKEFRDKTETVVLVIQDAGPEDKVPVFLQNGTLSEPCEAVTKLYSTPNQREIDPTPLMAPFFFAFFGMCLGDVGYGLILSLLAFLLLRKLKLGGMGKQLVTLLFICGIVSAAFGVLIGSYFGDLIRIKPIWFNPLDDPMRMLVYCFILGGIHLYFGMGIQAYRSIKDGRLLDAVFDQGFWYVFLTGLVLLLVLPGPISTFMAIGGALGLVMTQGRAQKGLLKKFFSGLMSLYNVTSYLSDVLSYSRLLALGLATGVIAAAINTMGGMLAKGVIGTVAMMILLLVGHAFNIVISSLGAYVHTSRLQYIEFFGKFFEGGGKAFRPFRITTQFVEIEEKEAL